MTNTLGQTLSLRFEFEEIVRTDYVLPNDRKFGTLKNLEYFIGNAFQKNRFRKGYKRAMEIANLILKESSHGRIGTRPRL
jgi:hypothetical protein